MPNKCIWQSVAPSGKANDGEDGFGSGARQSFVIQAISQAGNAVASCVSHKMSSGASGGILFPGADSLKKLDHDATAIDLRASSRKSDGPPSLA
jgi:hypothetical protein